MTESPVRFSNLRHSVAHSCSLSSTPSTSSRSYFATICRASTKSPLITASRRARYRSVIGVRFFRGGLVRPAYMRAARRIRFHPGDRDLGGHQDERPIVRGDDEECSEMALTFPLAHPWHHLIEPIVHLWSRSSREFLPHQAEGVDQLTERNLVADGGLLAWASFCRSVCKCTA